ncbi:hypothetical protein Tco_0303790 [Tanacetum coccineum]
MKIKVAVRLWNEQVKFSVWVFKGNDQQEGCCFGSRLKQKQRSSKVSKVVETKSTDSSFSPRYLHAAILCENSSKKVTIARLCVSAAKVNKETINAATKKVTSASAQCLIEDEDFVKRLSSTYTSSNHYKKPTDLEIQEMVNILVSWEAYDKVFNHLDMIHAPLEGKVLILTTAKSLLLLLV